jgi:hypothetical protein
MQAHGDVKRESRLGTDKGARPFNTTTRVSWADDLQATITALVQALLTVGAQ